MFQWESNLTESERVKKNVTNLMSIKKNEVCFDRNLGISADYLDKPEKKITSEMITDLLDMISEKEPRAEVSISDIISINANGEYTYRAVVNSV